MRAACMCQCFFAIGKTRAILSDFPAGKHTGPLDFSIAVSYARLNLVGTVNAWCANSKHTYIHCANSKGVVM